MVSKLQNYKSPKMLGHEIIVSLTMIKLLANAKSLDLLTP